MGTPQIYSWLLRFPWELQQASERGQSGGLSPEVWGLCYLWGGSVRTG